MQKEHFTFVILAAILLFAFIACTPPEETDPFAGIAKRDMVSITGGVYTQRDLVETFEHQVSSFSMAKYEVTYELWYTVYQWATSNGYSFANAGREGNDGTDGAAPTGSKYEPVIKISWRDIIVWCNAYSQMAGYSPCNTYGGNTIRDSRLANATACDNAVCIWTNNGYRLPTEGEWQYAASNKGGTPYDYASGATAPYTDATETQKVAWYVANSGGVSHNVGTTDYSSALTLWDMSGNAYEWCWDWNGTYPGSTTDYRGPLSGTQRVGRGGCYASGDTAQQVGQRSWGSPGTGYINWGFRLARTY
jgi:sulfatase modifying factor 1